MELIQKILIAIDREPKKGEIYSDAMDCLKNMGEDGLAFNTQLRQRSATAMGQAIQDKDFNLAEKLYNVHRDTYFFGANWVFEDFIIGLEYDKPPDKQFYLPRKHYLKPVVQGYQDLEDRLIDILSVSMPKRCGKSQTEINFALWVSGKKPNNATLMEGVGTDLVNSFYKGCLEYLEDTEQYNYYKIFPIARLVQTNADNKTINLQKKSRFPTIMCRSIDASQVGLSEATNALILDDTVEGYNEAKNRARLDEKWKVISGDVMGRAIPGTPIVITGTRYSLFDPIGRMQEFAKEQGKKIRIIETPALDLETDESNYAHMREGRVVFDTAYFREQRNLLTEEQFESEFQQQPVELKGMLFPKDSLNYYRELPVSKEPDAIIAVGDTAEKGSDSTSMPVAYLYGSEVFIHDLVFDNSEPKVTKPQCANVLKRNMVSSVTWESNNAGEYFGRDVAGILDSQGYKINSRFKRTNSNKLTRIEIASDNIKKYFYFKDKSTYDPNSQYAQFMKELTSYTRTGKAKHDDAPDSLSLLENVIRALSSGKVEILNRPF